MHTPTYNSWRLMRRRCSDPSMPSYRYYGGIGITVCKRWESFERFVSDMGERPDGMTLDRINGAKGYSPSNCRWVTLRVQNHNRKFKNGTSTFRGVSKSGTCNKWFAHISSEKYKQVKVGSFDNEVDAAKAYDRAAIRYFGEFAATNFPRDTYGD